jgi:hypothetical protein
MKHDRFTGGALFTKDEERVLTWSGDGTARLWPLEADYDFPSDYVPLLVEIATGTTMDNFGNIHALDSEDWNERREQYRKVAEMHLQRCKFKTANLYERQKQLWGIPENQASES